MGASDGLPGWLTMMGALGFYRQRAGAPDAKFWVIKGWREGIRTVFPGQRAYQRLPTSRFPL